VLNERDLVLAISGMRKDLLSAHTAFSLRVSEFNLRRGRFYGLVGRSGSGKSTLLDLLALVSRPTAVERFSLFVKEADRIVTHDLTGSGPGRLGVPSGDKLASRLRGRHFGYVLQSGGLFPFLSVLENAELPFKLSGRPCSRDRVLALARRLELEDQLSKKPAALSGGQRQRASILRALAVEPALLLADEPTGAVDETMAGIILRELKQLATEQQTTVVLVSHDQALVDEFADETVRLVPVRDPDGSVVTYCSLGAA
jgi:putative ABC transport system ATP-binding protein